jgi:aldehyde dehydrogenase (NAD+)
MTGAKQSGYGVKGGPWHIDEYLLNKSIWMNIGA